MKNQIMTFIIFILIITMTGCGGEKEESPPKESIAITQPTTVLTQVIIESTITTRELISEPDFDFISSTDIEITLPASPSTTTSYFINICTDFSKINDKVEINYESCKLRTTLTTLVQPFTLSLSNAELMLVAQIWPIEEGAQPVTVYWNIAESGSHWKISI